MNDYTNTTARHICAEPCYIADNDDNNPYRLTLYIADNGAIMLGADGNGCADDIPLEDIDGWSDADINSTYRKLDHNALVRNIDELRAAGTDGRRWLMDLEREEKERTGIHTLKVKFNRVFG